MKLFHVLIKTISKPLRYSKVQSHNFIYTFESSNMLAACNMVNNLLKQNGGLFVDSDSNGAKIWVNKDIIGTITVTEVLNGRQL